MFEHARMLDLIEHAQDVDPYCPVCGAPTTVDDRDGQLWLVCSATLTATTMIERVSAAILPHERRLVVDLSGGIAA
jgi:hypothetical protein